MADTVKSETEMLDMCVYLCACIFMCIYVYVFVYAYLCINIYKYFCASSPNFKKEFLEFGVLFLFLFLFLFWQVSRHDCNGHLCQWLYHLPFIICKTHFDLLCIVFSSRYRVGVLWRFMELFLWVVPSPGKHVMCTFSPSASPFCKRSLASLVKPLCSVWVPLLVLWLRNYL